MGKYTDMATRSQEMTRDEYIQTATSIFLDGGLSIKALMLMAMDWQRNHDIEWLKENAALYVHPNQRGFMSDMITDFEKTSINYGHPLDAATTSTKKGGEE